MSVNPSNQYIVTGVMIVSLEGEISSANEPLENLLGYEVGSLEGIKINQILPDEQNPDAPLGILSLLEDIHTTNTLCCKAITKDKKALPVEIVSVELEAGDEQYFVCTVRNIKQKENADKIELIIQEIIRVAMRGDGVKKLAPILCDNLLNIFNLETAWLATRKTNGDFKVNALAGKELPNIKAGETINWEDIPAVLPNIAHSLQICQLPTSFHNNNLNDSINALNETGKNRVLSFPLLFCRDPIGILEISTKEGYFDNDTENALRTLAMRIAVVIKMAQDQRSMKLLSAAISSAANAIIITDTAGKVIWVNQAFSEMSGYSEEEIIKQEISILKSGEQDDAFYKDLWETIKQGKQWSGEIVNRHKFGSLYTVKQTISPIINSEGKVSQFIAIHDDLTAEKDAERIISHMANYDQLTGLPNRALFQELLSQKIAEAENTESQIALIFIDISNFNIINDTMGHVMGDVLLRDISDRLSCMTSSDDILSRFGGDNFALATRIKSADKISQIAKQIIDNIAETIEIDGKEINLGAFVGIASYPDDAEDAEKLMKYADMAMHKAALIVPNTFYFFSQQINEETERRMILERDLRKAVPNHELLLNYQPQIDLARNRISGWEALVRWKHPTLGLISPVHFIPIAEDSGIILQIGEWVLKEALRQWREWREMGLPNAIMAVNLSAVQFQQEDLVSVVENALIDAGVTPDNLELELTESVIMQDADLAHEMLQKISNIGVKLAIDDFGTGYSSLSYLKSFPVDKLKIDRSFVMDMEKDFENARIADAIIKLGHSLGLEVISEGVENKAQLNLLKENGCDAIQGYLFGKPMSPDIIPDYVLNKKFIL
ncbi:MAG: EAL domain-containing protein [Alphaproteobacteria bacterium]|nr:EAL domain-containing protein [Alphaproteobacteria bacterium]